MMKRHRTVVEVMDDDMAEILREKTPAQRLEIAFAMWRSTRGMLVNLLASRHPEWSPEEVETEASRRLSHGAF